MTKAQKRPVQKVGTDKEAPKTHPQLNPKNEKTGGRNPAPCFLCPPTLFSPRPHPHAPQGIQATQSPRGQRPRACQPIGGGLHGAEPTFDPALRPGPITAYVPPVAGHPLPNYPQINFITKNGLHLSPE